MTQNVITVRSSFSEKKVIFESGYAEGFDEFGRCLVTFPLLFCVPMQARDWISESTAGGGEERGGRRRPAAKQVRTKAGHVLYTTSARHFLSRNTVIFFFSCHVQFFAFLKR